MTNPDEPRVTPRRPFSVWIAGTIDQCAHAAQTGLVDAVVTNPTVIADWCGEGTRSLEDVCAEAVRRTRLPLFVQLRGPGASDLLREAEALRAISPAILPKLPATPEGLIATAQLARQGVQTLVTTVCTARQAAMFASAGATFLCPYFSRLMEAGGDPIRMIRETADRFARDGVATGIFPASVRDPQQAEDAWLAGAGGAIVFFDVFMTLLEHDVTRRSLDGFERDDWPRIPTIDPSRGAVGKGNQ